MKILVKTDSSGNVISRMVVNDSEATPSGWKQVDDCPPKIYRGISPIYELKGSKVEKK